MVKDAEAHKGEDDKRKAVIEARNRADGLVHSTEKALKDHGDKVDAATKTEIETALADVKTALEGEDADDITAKAATLAQVSMKLGEAMYKAGEGGDDADVSPDANASAPDDEDVVDAEFEEVDDDKK